MSVCVFGGRGGLVIEGVRTGYPCFSGIFYHLSFPVRDGRRKGEKVERDLMMPKGHYLNIEGRGSRFRSWGFSVHDNMSKKCIDGR